MRYVASVGGRRFELEVSAGKGKYTVLINGRTLEVDVAKVGAAHLYSILVKGLSHQVSATNSKDTWSVWLDGQSYEVRVEEEALSRLREVGSKPTRLGRQMVRAPMPGLIVSVDVSPGDVVGPGSNLVVIEAMKMDNQLKAEGRGRVAEVLVSVGSTVNRGDPLVVLE